MDKDYKYKFSVVMPIYNVEKYVGETIESVINQDIGFEKNIQIILVDDGSPDNSREVCLQYQKMYPDNIIYIRQENAGVSAARNKGTEYVKGKYINYLDPDDKWEKDVFSKAYNMFEKYKDIDVIGVRQKYFEAWDSYPSLDYKFYKDRIVDIHEEYDCIQLSVAAGFIRTSAMKNKRFDTRIKISEDAKLLYEIILEKEKYGIISSSLYLYRRRYENNSAIQTSKDNISWYLDTMKLSYMYVCELSIKKYGRVIPFVQYYIMYDLQWRLDVPISNNLTNEQKNEYDKGIKYLIKLIDDNIILMQRSICFEQKIYALSLKYDRDVRKDFEYDRGRILYKNREVYNIQNKKFMQIYNMEVNKKTIILEGTIKDVYNKEDYEIYAIDNKKKKYNIEFFDLPIQDKISYNDEIFFKGIAFKVTVPLKKVKEIRLMIRYKGVHNRRLAIKFNSICGLDSTFKNNYFAKGNYIIMCRSNKIIVKKNTHKEHFKNELEVLKYLKKNKKTSIAMYRILYYLFRKIIRRKIWLVSDRANKADDNGMHLFKYLAKNEKNAKVYFVISKKSKDYKKMKKIGKVINKGSIKHKLYLLLSSNVISSQAEEWVTNPFAENKKFVCDLYRFKYTFLQHGITKDDLSKWLHKYNKNISLFVTAIQQEYDSIVNGNYGYTSKNVKLTGFPRYDTLKNDKKKQIVFMPTWRANIASKFDNKKGEREYNKGFKSTEYYLFYNKLINDKRILRCLERNGYTAKFCVHQAFEKQTKDFIENKFVKTICTNNYQKEFAENALLITDYSSVAFDFAYLNKPIIYTQFDVDTFFKGQVYDKGYYDYERDGFGPVCYDYESAVDEIIKAIDNDCKLEEKYRERINDFYAYHDKNNCKRVHEAILKLK